MGLEMQERMIEAGMKNIMKADVIELASPDTWMSKSFYYIA